MSFVFTGVRLPDYEKIITDNGGKVSSSVSKNTTYVVCKDPNSGSSKLEKAKSLGAGILGIDDLKKLLDEKCN